MAESGKEKNCYEDMIVKKPEFIAVYGRRRVGKTFLIDNTFENNLVEHR